MDKSLYDVGDKSITESRGWVDGRTLGEQYHLHLRKRMLATNSILKNDISELNKNGYLIIKNVLSKEKLLEVKQESAKLLKQIPKTKNTALGTTKLTRRFYSTVSSSRVYDDLILNKRVTDIIKYYLYTNYLLSVSMLIDICPGEIKQQLHKDNNTYMFGPETPTKNPLLLSTMWAITDFTEINGATRFVPGSHKWNKYRNVINKDKIIKATMPAGSVAIWFDSTLHGGGDNKSDTERIGGLIQYMQPWLRQQENAFLSMPFDEVKSLPKGIQSLIGYNVHAGAIGVVQGRHPIHALKRLANKQAKL